jgi:alcohol dehydrogenase/propanol-preferring alcohol dehydrogenase
MLSYQIETFGKPLARVLRETPQPQGSEVLLRTTCCGVCHSDVHLHEGFFNLGAGGKVDLTRSISPPRTLGHEIVGTVVAVGPEAQGVAVGDQRVVYPWIGCGRCGLCQAGHEELCNAPRGLGIQLDGGFADHVLVPHARYLLAFDPLPPEQACTLACAGVTAWGALKKAGPLGEADPWLIIGAGGVGLSAVRLARQLYGRAPIVAELDRSKWDLALQAGAAECISPADPGVVRQLMAATGGGVSAAVDFVGAGETFAFGLSVLRKAGKLVSVGLFGGSTPVMPALVVLKALSVSGSYVGSLQEMHELMALARAGTLPPLPVTTRPLEAAGEVIADLAAGRIRGRTVLVP